MAGKKNINAAAAKKAADKKVKAAKPVVAPVAAAVAIEADEVAFYTVLRPVHHGSGQYKIDDLIELDEAEAAPLLKTKAIEPFVDDEVAAE